MPTYEFGCNSCGEVFDHIYQSVPKKMPKTKKCITCGKKASRLISAPSAIKVSGKIAKIGKSNVTQFYNEAIQDSKSYLANMKSPYKRYQANADWLVETGQIKKVSESEAKSRSVKENKAIENINQIKSRSKKK
jgi:putative FmdB family regulatory protein